MLRALFISPLNRMILGGLRVKSILTNVLGASVLTIGVLSMSASSATAATLVDTLKGNDNSNPIEYEGMTYDFFGKYDVDDSKFTGNEFLIDLGPLDDGEAKDGTATVASGGAGLYSVKAGNGYALYYTDDLSNIDWNTSDRQNKGLSHLSVWRTRTIVPQPETIPEPASLLGLAAVGVAVAGGALKKRAIA